MPLSLSVVRSLLVEVQNEIYAFPLAYVNHALQVSASDIEQLEGHQHFRFMDRQVGLVSARQILRSGEPAPAAESVCVVLVGDERLYGIAVDRYVGERTVVDAAAGPAPGQGAGRDGRGVDGRRPAARSWMSRTCCCRCRSSSRAAG